MARLLGARGTDVVLVARGEERLRSLAEELSAGHPGLRTEVLTADLTTDAGMAAVEARLADASRPVDLLVNNAGFGAAGRFVEQDAQRWADMIACNVTAVVRLTRAAVPGMIERARGNVVNVSSVAGAQPVPGTAVYGSTKAFVTSFSEALHEELRGTGVAVTAVLPGFTRTEFQERAGHLDATRGLPGFLWQDAAAVAAEALDAAARGRAVVVCGRLNKVAVAAVGSLPRTVKRRAAALVTSRI